MSKTISVPKSKKRGTPAAKGKGREINPHEISKEPKNAFDFGGLPMRDIKKNIGCG